MSNGMHSLVLILTMAAITVLLRFLPFVLFAKKTPAPILFLASRLPNAIMAMLVVYCLKNVSFLSGTHGIPEIMAVVLVAVLHKWKHNTLLSILGGTAAYMVLVQAVF